jgi:hypothetical protein
MNPITSLNISNEITQVAAAASFQNDNNKRKLLSKSASGRLEYMRSTATLNIGPAASICLEYTEEDCEPAYSLRANDKTDDIKRKWVEFDYDNLVFYLNRMDAINSSFNTNYTYNNEWQDKSPYHFFWNDSIGVVKGILACIDVSKILCIFKCE